MTEDRVGDPKDERMFFVPYVDKEHEQEVYGAIKQHISASMGSTISGRKIFGLRYYDSEDQRHCYVAVGEKNPITDEVVRAILSSEGMYYVCTPFRGILGGTPIIAGRDQVSEVIEFEE
jgi:hypothetical protein